MTSPSLAFPFWEPATLTQHCYIKSVWILVFLLGPNLAVAFICNPGQLLSHFSAPSPSLFHKSWLVCFVSHFIPDGLVLDLHQIVNDLYLYSTLSSPGDLKHSVIHTRIHTVESRLLYRAINLSIHQQPSVLEWGLNHRHQSAISFLHSEICVNML